MPQNGQIAAPPLRLQRATLALVLTWTVLVAALLAWNIQLERSRNSKLAQATAIAHFNKDQAFRLWGASHGGVYVPTNERTPPSEHLAHIPERDITTPSGVALTLMDPAYMVRQMNEEFAEYYGVAGRITSLKPLRPENAPDSWERAALERFELGEREVQERTKIDGEPFLRLMRPIFTEQACLECHAHQGIEVGDICGGIVISLPLSPIMAHEQSHIQSQALSYGSLWFLGCGGILLGSRRIQSRIRDRQHAEEALLRERQLFVGGPVIVFRWVAAEGWPVEYVSPNVLDMFGHSAEDFTSGRVPYAGIVHPDDLARVGAEVARHSKQGAANFEQEYRIVRPDGGTRWLHDFTVVHRIEDGTITHYEGYVLDVTQRRQAEVAAHAAQSELLEHQRGETGRVQADLEKVRKQLVNKTRLATIGQIAGSISHELLNPLGAARNAAYYLKRYTAHPDPDMLEHLEIIEQEISTADRIISDMTDMTRAKQPRKQTVDLRRAVTDVLQRIKPPAEIHCDLQLSVDPFTLEADASQFGQVLANLINNAIQAMDGTGSVTIEAQHKEAWDIITVHDSGPGVKPDDCDRLFEAIFTTKAKGTGLGLTICRDIAERHGGSIDLIDDNRPGATFRIRLPRASTPKSPANHGASHHDT